MMQQNKCPGRTSVAIKETASIPRYRGIGKNVALQAMRYNSKKYGIAPHIVGLST